MKITNPLENTMTEKIPTDKDLEETAGSFCFRYVDLELELPDNVIPFPIKEEPEDLIA